ncbi:MAG: zinc transporter ZupT [Chloroflexota bacterium]|nr:MAG: zinc transporter ZupT [Chloroflexota bacterium]
MTFADALLPLLLTTVAGLSTGLGSLIVLIVRNPGRWFTAFMLGMAAGVMVLVSFVELLGGAIAELGFLQASLAFFAAMVGLFLVDVMTPHVFMSERQTTGASRLARTGTMVALGLAIHNFPEGLAVFASALSSLELGLVLTLAIAIHNIPEGIAVAMPIYAATGSRRQAFWVSFYTGLAEPVGALIGALFLLPLLTPQILSYLLAAVGGVMVFISLDELLPAAHKVGDEHPIILGVMVGMIIMTLSLALLR